MPAPKAILARLAELANEARLREKQRAAYKAAVAHLDNPPTQQEWLDSLAKPMKQGVYRGYAGEASAMTLPDSVFVAAQKPLAEVYANRRAAQTGQDPHMEMFLSDKLLDIKDPRTQTYRLHPPEARDMSTVRKSKPQELSGRTQLYASGGAVKDVWKQGARGWAAGLAGLPGDLEGLARMLIKYGASPGAYVDRNMEVTPSLPTSDFYREWLPGGDWETPEGGLAQDIGTALGGAGIHKFTKPTARAIDLAVKYAPKMVENAMIPATLGKQAGVIKAPGGNWLSGSVEDALKGLKIQGPIPRVAPGRFERPAPDNAMNNWIDKQLTKYVKNDMATERDPVRALAERGITHRPGVTENAGVGWEPDELAGMRAQMGFPKEGVAKSNIAKDWEMASDYALQPARAGEYLSPDLINKYLLGKVEQNPWLAKVPPETPVYGIDRAAMGPELDFNHLIDELRNATNPASGLPRELLLKPESLARVSVPQAVEHVAKINAWREAQKVEANAAIANNAATHVFKEYAENNPKGLRWVELKIPESVDPAAFANDVRIKKSLGDTVEARGPRLALEDALKYEGNTMGHCVGGYCDEVASGKSRIFSLRDKKGQPHVTIEVKPPFADIHGNDADLFAQASAKADAAFPEDDWGTEAHQMMIERLLKKGKVDRPPQIVQIRGKQNQKPKDEYLPYVQDFVRSQKWSNVGDLQNTGLRQFSGVGPTQGLFGPEGEVLKELKLAPIEGYYTPEELAAHLDAVKPADINADYWEGLLRNLVNPRYAAGGLVATDYDPTAIAARAEKLFAELQ